MPHFRPPSLLALLALLALPAAALADPPDTCQIITLDEINAIAENSVEKVQPRKGGNPSECAFLAARSIAVLVVSIREVKYAVRDEFHYERENLEKIYKAKAKQLDTIGEGAFWLAPNKQMMFRKKKFIVSVIFSRVKNQNEIDSAQVARLIESRL